MEELNIKGKLAVKASGILLKTSTAVKNSVLVDAAQMLIQNSGKILSANKLDLEAAENNGIQGALLDRLTLNESRIKSMAEGLDQISQLDDPVGEVISMKKRPNGLTIGQKRVPMGVIGIIYEARPNVTADAFGLCLKTGNATILRGGKEAIHSNKAIVEVLQGALVKNNLPDGCVQLVENTSRESAVAMMKLNEYLDLLIPRGGAGLINTVVQNSTVPVIETGVGNCHVYADEFANPEMAIEIIVNAKTQRPGVCNAAESLLVHSSMADIILPEMGKRLKQHDVEIRGDKKTLELVEDSVPASEEDWGAE